MDTLLVIEDADMHAAGLPPQQAALLRQALREEQARRRVADKSNSLVAFLQCVGLEQYADTLLRHGFDEMDTLLLIEEADMKELGLPRGHVLKLRKKLQEYQDGQHRGQQVDPEAAEVAPMRDPPAHKPKRASSLALESWAQVKL